MSGHIGKYAFVVGVILAIILGLVSAEGLGSARGWLWSILVVLGLVVGLMNVSGKDVKEFLWIVAALVVVAYAANTQIAALANVELIGVYISGVFNSIMAFIVPAAVVAALKAAWNLAKGQ